MHFIFALVSAAFFASATVIGAATNPGAHYLRAASVGASIGAAWGFARLFLIDFVGLSLPSPYLGVALTAAVAAGAAALAARFAVNPKGRMPRCAMVAGGYALAVLLCNRIALNLGNYSFGRYVDISSNPNPPAALSLAVPAAVLALDGAITVAAFCFVKSRLSAKPPVDPATN